MHCNLEYFFRLKTTECLKQHSVHLHEVDHQLGSACHIVLRSFKPRTLSGRRSVVIIWSLHLIGMLPLLLVSSTIPNWMLFLQLVRALLLQLYIVFLQCLGSSMLSTPIVLESLNGPLLLETVCHPRSLHRVCRSVYLTFFNSYALWHLSFQVLSVPQWQGAL